MQLQLTTQAVLLPEAAAGVAVVAVTAQLSKQAVVAQGEVVLVLMAALVEMAAVPVTEQMVQLLLVVLAFQPKLTGALGVMVVVEVLLVQRALLEIPKADNRVVQVDIAPRQALVPTSLGQTQVLVTGLWGKQCALASPHPHPVFGLRNDGQARVQCQ
jgi:hypothetical protein